MPSSVEYGWWLCRPAFTLSNTVSSLNRRIFWKVLAMPARLISMVFFPTMFSPSSVMIPSFGRYTPVSRLKTVVLPAPLGPIRPYRQPFSICRWNSFTARSPPKEIPRFFTSSNAMILKPPLPLLFSLHGTSPHTSLSTRSPWGSSWRASSRSAPPRRSASGNHLSSAAVPGAASARWPRWWNLGYFRCRPVRRIPRSWWTCYIRSSSAGPSESPGCGHRSHPPRPPAPRRWKRPSACIWSHWSRWTPPRSDCRGSPWWRGRSGNGSGSVR